MSMNPGKTVMKNMAATAMPATTKNADWASRARRPTRGRGGSGSIGRSTRRAGDPSQFSPSGTLRPAGRAERPPSRALSPTDVSFCKTA